MIMEYYLDNLINIENKIDNKINLDITDMKILLDLILLNYNQELSKEDEECLKIILSKLYNFNKTQNCSDIYKYEETQFRYDQENIQDDLALSNLKIFLTDKTRRFLSKILLKDFE